MYPTIHIILPSYAVLAVIGGLSAMLFIYFRIEKFNLPFLDFLKMFGLSVIFGFLGSRVIYIFSRIPWLINNFSVRHLISTVLSGGLVFYGGLLGVLFSIYYYCKRHNIASSNIFNLIAPAIPLFHAFGRIGCFMSGCCYGIELSSPVTLFGVITFNRLPTQIIEAVFEFVLFIIILLLQRKEKCHDYLKAYLMPYAVFRFIIEFFRGDAVRGFFFGFSTSQIISIAILTFYIAKKIKEKIHNRKVESI